MMRDRKYAIGRQRLMLATVGAWLSCVPCCCSLVQAGSPASEPRAAAPSARCYVLAIEGMTCKECAEHVQKALAKVPGVSEAHVDYTKAEATVCTKPGANVRAETLIAAVKQAGYRAKLKKQS